MKIVLNLIALAACATAKLSEEYKVFDDSAASWDYSESSQKEWEETWPECGYKGGNSPIDIDKTSHNKYAYKKNKFLPNLELTELKEEFDLTLLNNGHFLELSGMPESVLTGGPVLGEESYKLIGGELHWGKSEHQVNDKHAEGEMYFIFERDSQEESTYNADFITLSVLLDVGSKDKKDLGSIVDEWESLVEVNSVSTVAEVTLQSLLPDKKHKEFYMYDGHSSHPPCKAEMTYIVYRNKNKMSKKQFKKFEKLENIGGEAMKKNYRKEQTLGNRVVVNSFSNGLDKGNKNDGGFDMMDLFSQ